MSRPLASYLDDEGRTRELLVRPGHGGSVLVLDRDAATLADRRLIAHLAADEPPENARLVCRLYVEDPSGRWCRRVHWADFRVPPLSGPEHGAMVGCDGEGVQMIGRDGEGAQMLDVNGEGAQVVDRHGNSYRIGLLPGERKSPQLRWCRCVGAAPDGRWEQVCLREVVAALESYEPMRPLTERAIACHSGDTDVMMTRLRHELERLSVSPIVLNRGLREAVLDAVQRRGMSMSEIALRCGAVKRDRRGRLSGETSWLARRVGLMPEGGERAVTPWVHSDVLALIARDGLGVSPREVEVQ